MENCTSIREDGRTPNQTLSTFSRTEATELQDKKTEEQKGNQNNHGVWDVQCGLTKRYFGTFWYIFIFILFYLYLCVFLTLKSCFYNLFLSIKFILKKGWKNEQWKHNWLLMNRKRDENKINIKVNTSTHGRLYYFIRERCKVQQIHQ